MDFGIGSSSNPSGSEASELETLQRLHDEKMSRIQELKRQIESVKLHLEEKKKKKKRDVPEDRKQAFMFLSEKYKSLREEYNALLAERSREQN